MTERPQYYRLDGRVAVPCEMMEWALMFRDIGQRRVAHTTLPNGYRISTVFLGLDHNFFDDGPPLIFESMTFPSTGHDEQLCARCSTWEEAEAQHARMVMETRLRLGPLLLAYIHKSSAPHD